MGSIHAYTLLSAFAARFASPGGFCFQLTIKTYYAILTKEGGDCLTCFIVTYSENRQDVQKYEIMAKDIYDAYDRFVMMNYEKGISVWVLHIEAK